VQVSNFESASRLRALLFPKANLICPKFLEHSRGNGSVGELAKINLQILVCTERDGLASEIGK
jgi:hypothetical protein